MRIINLKKNRGFVILFAVTISAILLAIALGVENIALKEIKFGTSARDTNDAFFAADTGAECALYYDKVGINAFVDPSSPSITCNNSSPVTAIESPTSFWSFTISQLSNGGQGCVKVTVDKRSSIPPFTTIDSKGYNDGGGTAGSCSQGINSVERELQLNY